MAQLKIYDRNLSDSLMALANGISLANNYGDYEFEGLQDSDDSRYVKMVVFTHYNEPHDIFFEWDGGRLKKIGLDKGSV